MPIIVSQEELEAGDVLATALQRSWRFFLFGGVATTIVGLLLLSWHHSSLNVVTWFAGILMFLVGILDFGGALVAPRHRIMHIVMAILTIGVGVALVSWPHITYFIVGVLVGWVLVLGGLANIIVAFMERRVASLWPGLVRGLIEVALGVWALRRPETATNILVIIVGIWAVASGVLGVIAAFSARHAEADWAEFKASLS